MGSKMLLLHPALVMYNRIISMLGSCCLLVLQNLDICENILQVKLVFQCEINTKF